MPKLTPLDINNFKSGTFRKENSYKWFMPEHVNREWVVSSAEVNTLLSRADICMGELRALSQYIPDVSLFIRMHVVKEATQSSRIEGTQTSVEEAFLEANEISSEKRDDWDEVQNYITAMNEAIAQLHTLPLSSRLLKNAHKTLLQGVRGKHKLPGEFRSSQNWLGGATLRDAVFIPPQHNEVAGLMSDLEKFLNNDEIQVPALLRIAIGHYQFETIHPFLDGNGRLGRLLITLYLVSEGILNTPTLYLSDFFERHKGLYYDNLTAVREKNALSQWLKFFLVGVIETAQNSIDTFRAILNLKEEMEECILALGRKIPLARKFLRLLYTHPVAGPAFLQEALGVSRPTVHGIIADFEKLGILKEITGQQRNTLYRFDKYLKLFER